ncbi:helix-turn-helix domain-containing protein [Streptomyces sp. NBC_01723]|uniref:helix-turn-helix domain-containing protein n=1 Tax=Streptomyces sp. NBC_01723 TaxID=2975921 RepID=UPI002E2EC968|nr:helix-turn-helix domain-containing protein [Streptomyces sp. NBC_01723]
MNTTAAATEARVTTATIRTWCRRGVIAATKQAGRWIIDTTSLAARITIGAMRTRKANPVTINLAGTYTHADTTVTTTTKTRTRKTGYTWTTITGLAPLFADRLNAITDDGDRTATLIALTGSQITITDQIEEGPDEIVNGIAFLDQGRLRIKHQPTAAIPMDTVIDLAKQIRAQLAA